jgi:hypothetical protein
MPKPSRATPTNAETIPAATALDEDECGGGAVAGLVPLVGIAIIDDDARVVEVVVLEAGVDVDRNDDVVTEGAAIVLSSILQKDPVLAPPFSQAYPRGQHSEPHSGKDTLRSLVCSEEFGNFVAS